MQKHAQIFQQLATIVKTEQIQTWETIGQPLQQQILRAIAPPHQLSCIVYPHTQTELAEIVACTHRHNWTILPCGYGSKLHWGGLAKSIDVVISTAHLNRVIDHAVGDLTITTEAGLPYADLQSQLTPLSQQLALDPVCPDYATLGGIIATADAGFLRQRYGGARDMVIGLSFVRSDGQLAKAGGRVVKNVAGYDLMKLLTGSWGTLGIITQLTLRLYPQSETSKTILLTGDPNAIETVASQLFSSSLTPTAFTILLPETTQLLDVMPSGFSDTDTTSTHSQPLTLLVRFQSIAVSVNQQTKTLIEWGQHYQLIEQVFESTDESMLWSRIQQQIQPESLRQSATYCTPSSIASPSIASSSTASSQVMCKIGVLPAQVVATLTDLMTTYPHIQGWIHAGSGLGLLWADAEYLAKGDIEKMRSQCEASGGFLTVLEAPIEWKQSIDLWGYKGNALPIMNRIKQQFDPHAHLSPGRFTVSA